jgi:hypothetical protein
VGAHADNTSIQKAEAGGSQVQGQPELHTKSLYLIFLCVCAGGMARNIECLPTKCEALSSSPINKFLIEKEQARAWRLENMTHCLTT